MVVFLLLAAFGIAIALALGIFGVLVGCVSCAGRATSPGGLLPAVRPLAPMPG